MDSGVAPQKHGHLVVSRALGDMHVRCLVRPVAAGEQGLEVVVGALSARAGVPLLDPRTRDGNEESVAVEETLEVVGAGGAGNLIRAACRSVDTRRTTMVFSATRSARSVRSELSTSRYPFSGYQYGRGRLTSASGGSTPAAVTEWTLMPAPSSTRLMILRPSALSFCSLTSRTLNSVGSST
jgi:hypothetical protein